MIPNFLSSKKKRVISLNKNSRTMSKRIEDVLKLNIDGYEKKLVNFTKSKDFSKTLEKNEDSTIAANPLLLSTSIKQVQRFLPNINILLNTESNFNYNPSRQEHMKFEEKIKKEISFYENEEKELRAKLNELESNLLKLNNKISDCKVGIQALKSVSVNNIKSPLRRAITKQLEEDFNKEENNLMLKYTPVKNGSRKFFRMNSRQAGFNSTDFTTRLNKKLLEEEKLNKEKQKNMESNIEIISSEKENEHKKLIEIIEELKIVHSNKKILIDQLYKHYLSLLKEGKDSRKEGLAWIIMEIFYLNKKVLFSNFPKYMDNDCIHYLFKMANINIRIIQLESKVKNKKEYLNKNIKNYNINKSIMNYFYDDNDDNPNNYEYNKKQLSSLISMFSQKYNNTSNNNSNIFQKERINNEGNLLFSEDNNNSFQSKEQFNFKTSKINANKNNNNTEKSLEYFYKKTKKKEYKVNEMEKLFEKINKSKINNSFKENDTLKSNEYQTYFSLSNELFYLKQEKEKLKLSEMDRIFKEFQKNNYKQRYQVEKKTVISALIGEDNLENELFRQAKREKEYMYKMNKIQLFQNKYKGPKSFI